MRRFLGVLLLAGVIAGGSWVIAQQGSAPPSAPPAALPPPTSSATPASAPPAAKSATPPAPQPPPSVNVPNVSPFPPPPPPPANAVAAVVNGQTIPELAVYRAIVQSERTNIPELRKEVLDILVDNALVDQYLQALKIDVDKKEIDESIEQLKKEAAENKEDFAKILESFKMTEEELRFHLVGTLRWDKFVAQQSTDKALHDFFAKNKNMFDGSQVQVRHILMQERDGAKAELSALKKQIEDQLAQELAQLPATTDNLAREKERLKILEQLFAKTAKEKSACDSKEQGGDIGWIPRLGKTVEPFARAAFVLKPHQISDPVQTEFGYHLILVMDVHQGADVKFDDLRPFVSRVYASRLREAVLLQMRPSAKIVINPAPKTN